MLRLNACCVLRLHHTQILKYKWKTKNYLYQQRVGHRACRGLDPFPVIYKIPAHQIPVAVQQKLAKKQVLTGFERSQLLGVVYNHITTTYVRGL